MPMLFCMAFTVYSEEAQASMNCFDVFFYAKR
jgi:hypothetical protein